MLTPILLALLVGVLISVHVSMNATAGALAGNADYANAVFWFVGFITALALALRRADPGFLERARALPPWLFAAGAVGASISLFTNVAIPRLGIAALSLLLILGQLFASMMLSHWGLLSSPREPVNLQRLGGLVLACLGAALFILGGRPR